MSDLDTMVDELIQERDHWRDLCTNLVLDRNITDLKKNAPDSPLLPFLLGVRNGLNGKFSVPDEKTSRTPAELLPVRKGRGGYRPRKPILEVEVNAEGQTG